MKVFSMTEIVLGRSLSYGQAQGEILALSEPISFWGGVDNSGMIVDAHHPEKGQSVTGKILVLETGRGSSTGAYGVLELIRADLAPAGIVLAQTDGVIMTGVLVGAEIYQKKLPVVMVAHTDFSRLKTGLWADLSALPERGTVTVNH